MANATSLVKKEMVHPYRFAKRSSATLSAETTFYRNAMLGITTGGYIAKFDDTQSLILAGVVRGEDGTNPVLPIGTAGDGTIDLDYDMPEAFAVALSSVAVTDIGKNCYATFDQTATLDPSATTYANLIGKVIDKVGTSIALVRPAFLGCADNLSFGAAKWLAATGTQTLSKWDCGKTIFIPSTGAFTINLPAVAGCPAGSRLTFVKTTSNAVAATLDGDGAETIDGAATLASIDAQFDCATLVSTGVEWIVSARDIT